MSLKKFNTCDVSHYQDFEYVCLREKKVFCFKCWIKVQHFRHCQSTRCGQYTKLAHLTLNRALQYKNSKLLEFMCATPDLYENLRVRFLQINFQVTEAMKQFVEEKMPLLLWGMTNELLKARLGGGAQNIPNLNKFDSYCSDMIKIIKLNDKNNRLLNLQAVIGAYYDINHQLEGELTHIRSSGITQSNHKEDHVLDVLDKMKSQLLEMMSNIKKGFRVTMDTQIQKTTKNIDATAKYKSITFQKITPQNECFRHREQYPFLNLVTQSYSNIVNDERDLHMGFHLNLGELQSNPEQLLQVSKCFLKQRLHTVYDKISSIKSVFPYKYAYPIATTLSNDQQYEELLIDLQRTVIDAPDKANPFLSSLILTIIGREVIIIKFFNQPKFCFTRKIYNYKKKRQGYYEILLEKFGLKGLTQRYSSTPDLIQYSEELSDTQLVYCNFRIAYENIFLCAGEDMIFEGEKVMSNRGAQQFYDMIQKWKKMAKINFQFRNPETEMMKFFV